MSVTVCGSSPAHGLQSTWSRAHIRCVPLTSTHLVKSITQHNIVYIPRSIYQNNVPDTQYQGCICNLTVCAFSHWNMFTPLHTLTHTLIILQCMHAYAGQYRCIHHSFAHSFVTITVHIVKLAIRQYAVQRNRQSFIHSSIHPFIHSFIHSFIRSQTATTNCYVSCIHHHCAAEYPIQPQAQQQKYPVVYPIYSRLYHRQHHNHLPETSRVIQCYYLVHRRLAMVTPSDNVQCKFQADTIIIISVDYVYI